MELSNNIGSTLNNILSTNYKMTERDRLIVSFIVFNIPSDVEVDILEAYDFYLLYPDLFDGSTGSEESWVTKYEPAPLRHDRDYNLYGGTHKGRLYSDLKFKRYKKLWRASTLWANIQYYAVRWGGRYFQIKNHKRGSNTLPSLVELNKYKRKWYELLIEYLGIISIFPFLLFFIGAWVTDLFDDRD